MISTMFMASTAMIFAPLPSYEEIIVFLGLMVGVGWIGFMLLEYEDANPDKREKFLKDYEKLITCPSNTCGVCWYYHWDDTIWAHNPITRTSFGAYCNRSFSCL